MIAWVGFGTFYKSDIPGDDGEIPSQYPCLCIDPVYRELLHHLLAPLCQTPEIIHLREDNLSLQQGNDKMQGQET